MQQLVSADSLRRVRNLYGLLRGAARAFDTLIAATAMANEFDLYTCNPHDFEQIDGLHVVAVPHPDHEH